MPSEQPSHALAGKNYEFGPFRFDVSRRTLYREGEFIPLAPKAAELLLLLLEEAGRVVTKDQLLARVWPGVVIEEGAIANNISALRKILDAAFGGDGPIATVARRGYRFSAPVRGDIDSALLTAQPAATATPLPPSVKAAPKGEREKILVADIENKTGDAIFDETIRTALVLHLAQSEFLDVLTDRKVHSFLTIMNKPGVALQGEVALEVAQRASAGAVVTGSIFALGEDYVIGLQALHPVTGDVLVTEQARAHGKAAILAALDRAAIGLRTKLGESLKEVEELSRGIEVIATASLEALKAYTQGRKEWFHHGEATAKPHYLRAIALDPDFGSAYSALALICLNMGQTNEAAEFMQKSWNVRERATDHERMRIEAGYHNIVTGDLFKGMDAHRAWARSKPNDPSASANLANLYMMIGQWDKAWETGLSAHAIESSIISASNLTIAQLANGRIDDAAETVREAFELGHDSFVQHLDAFQIAYLRGDATAMKRAVEAVGGRAGEEDFLIAAEADAEACRGHFQRARVLSKRAVESARKAGSLEVAGFWEAEAALREAEVGVHELARAGGAAALEMNPGRVVYGMAGLALARGGNVKRAEELATWLRNEWPQDTLVMRYWVPCIEASLAMAKKDWAAAIDALDVAKAVELGQTQPLEGAMMYPPYLRGLALKGAGRKEEALVEFMKIIDRPGLIKNFVLHPLALRAAGMLDRFRVMWATADPDLKLD
jgi:DNA-binding winged helix-turn-helix (wHTH) protein/Flp pilus assembly protein TadD